MRLFISMEFPDEIKAAIHQVATRLKTPLESMGTKIRWVSPERFHLTIKFLGDTEKERILGLTDSIRKAVQNQAPIEVSLQGLGCFPPSGPPKVLWLGLPKAEADLRRVVEDVETACDALGFAREKRLFSAHLTLGRIERPGKSGELRSHLETLEPTPIGPVRLHSLSLMESRLTPAGPHYSTVETFYFPRR